MDEDERRRVALESGKEMLEKYKAEQAGQCLTKDVNRVNEFSDGESSHNDRNIAKVEEHNIEGLSSRDVTQSSISMSEGNGDLEGIAGRLGELEEILHGKEAIIESLYAEIDSVKAETGSPNSSQSQISNCQLSNITTIYRHKVEELEAAVSRRDAIIEELTTSLSLALSSRDAAVNQLKSFNNVHFPNANTMNNSNLQEKIDLLEKTLSEQRSVIDKLNNQVFQFHGYIKQLESEKKNLNQQVEVDSSNNILSGAEASDRKLYESHVRKIEQDMSSMVEKFTDELNTNNSNHQYQVQCLKENHNAEIAKMQVKYDEQLRALRDENKILLDRLNKDLPNLESTHAKELSIFQSQLTHCKKTIEALKLELLNHTQSQQSMELEVSTYKSKLEETLNNQQCHEKQYEEEREMLHEQIELHKLQLNDLTAKYISTTAILESKESIERSLEEALASTSHLQKENEELRFQLNDLSHRYSSAQSLIESNQIHERNLSSKIFDLEKSLARYSSTNISALSELNDTSYQTFDEIALQYQIAMKKLDEKREMENTLTSKLNNLEESVKKTQEELEQANLAKKSYEKQLKDMKNMCDKLQSEINTLRLGKIEDTSSELSHKELDNSIVRDLEQYKQDIISMKSIMEKKDTEILEYKLKLNEATEKFKKYETECERLKSGLVNAWTQCMAFQEQINQTLGSNDTKIDFSQLASDYDITLTPNGTMDCSLNISQSYCKPMNDQRLDNTDVSDSVTVKTLQSEIDALKNENENALKDMEQLLKKLSDYDELTQKLNECRTKCETLIREKKYLEEENVSLKNIQDSTNLLQQQIDKLNQEKILLQADIKSLTEKQVEEVDKLKAECLAEVEKIQSILSCTKENNEKVVENLKTELEKRHAEEMKELRTYFEEKCLQMEKQYSEDVFSQQSKKMSDNDSEIEELTEDLYLCGAGDCLNVTHVPDQNSTSDIPMEESIAKEIQDIKSFYENKLEEQKLFFEKQIEETRRNSTRVALLKSVHQHCQTEWDENALENGELFKLREEYNRQLEEQIIQIRLDVVNDLKIQIQALLSGEGEIPSDLLELQDKFTSNARREMEKMKIEHHSEIMRLKEESARQLRELKDHYETTLNRGTEDNISCEDEMKSVSHSNLLRERNNLHKLCVVLKTLTSELIRYFAICEEELNNTLISEVLKRQLSDTKLATLKEDSYENSGMESSVDPENSLQEKPKRVHFAPQLDEIISIINNDSETLEKSLDENFTFKIRGELKNSLHRLKRESALVLGIEASSGEDVNKPTIEDVFNINSKTVEDLTLQLNQAKELIMDYEDESELLKIKILELQQKLINMESRKEIISEGYGEHGSNEDDTVLQDFSLVQEKARNALSNGIEDCSYLLQIIEELSRQSDRLIEESKKEKDDLQQQIEAADKQLRATRKFLDEQATEREIERDEFSKQIESLQEQLKERDREKERDMRICSEQPTLSPDSLSGNPVLLPSYVNAAVETIETQMLQMSSMMTEVEAKRTKVEGELKAAVDKVWVLRDIITELEQQLQSKCEHEESLQLQISQLEAVVAAQTKNQEMLVQELDAIRMGTESVQLNEHISHLQEELKKHKLSSEHFNANSTVLKQMKLELHDMLNQLDKRIKELESLHMCDSNLSLSQPSEDVSIKDQIEASRCPTPEDPNAPPMLPLDLLLKVKEKMSKHIRVEEVTLKRLKDIDMQLTLVKNQNEELHAEHEILQQTISEQLFQIETMRGRLEQHKQNAPFAHKQATSRLEMQLHETNNRLQSLERVLSNKEIEYNEIKLQLDRAHQLLREKEIEIANVVEMEGMAIQKLKERLKVLEEEKRILEIKHNSQEKTQLELPQLIDSILADKNYEIDNLKEQLSKKEKQLEMYSSLPLDEMQLKEHFKHAELKHSARTLSDILSIHSECEDVEAIRAIPNISNIMAHNMSTLKSHVTSGTYKDTLDGSTMPLIDTNVEGIRIPPLDLDSDSACSSANRQQYSQFPTEDLPRNDESNSYVDGSNADNTSKNGSSTRKDMNDKQSEIILSREKIKDLENQLNHVYKELQEKSEIINKRDAELMELQKNVSDVQEEYRDIIESVTCDKNFYKNQYELMHASENKIRQDLEEVENILKLTTQESLDYKNQILAQEKLIMELNTENRKLKNTLSSEKDNRRFDAILEENALKLKNLNDMILEKDITIETLKTRNFEIENENKQLYDYKTRYEQCKHELMKLQNEMKKLINGLNDRDQVISRLEEMMKNATSSGLSTPPDEKDQEIYHLQEYLKEKDKVIREMSEDSKSLREALETIQNKMKESGNVVDLRRKLKEKKKVNNELMTTVENLSKELDEMKEHYSLQMQEDIDMEDIVNQEINLSAHLDRQIMDAVHNDPHVIQNLQETEIQNYTDIKRKLQQVTKINEDLNKLKDELEIEREMLKSQVVEYENRIFQIKADLDIEKKKVEKLEEELTMEKNSVRNLKILIDKERRSALSSNINYSERIEFLQAKLKSSLDVEDKLRNELSLMRQEHKHLEMQLSTVKEKMKSQNIDNLPGITELLQMEQKKYITIVEEFEKEQRNNSELQNTLKTLEAENKRCKKDLEILVEENEKLISSLALSQETKGQLETDLKRTKDELKTKIKEYDWLQTKFKELVQMDSERQKKLSSERSELKALRREINNTRELMTDLEDDIKQYKMELQNSNEREIRLQQAVEDAKKREMDLNMKLNDAYEKETRLKEIVVDLQKNSEISSQKETDLMKELNDSKFFSQQSTTNSYTQKIKKLNYLNEQYCNEIQILHDQIFQISKEKNQLSTRLNILESQSATRPTQNEQAVKSVVTEKVRQFYGKYLRADSKRKALVYQKKYLLCVIRGHQLSEESTAVFLARLTIEERRKITYNGKRQIPKKRFQIVSKVIISIIRMKWLVMRWSVGKRVGADNLLGNGEQSFIPIQRSVSSHSPPVRERQHRIIDLNSHYQRLKSIQHTLGLINVDRESSE